MLLPASWPLHLAAGSVGPASVHKTLPAGLSNRHAHLDSNGYFYSVTYTLQTDSPHPPNIPHQQVSALYFGATLPSPVLGSLYGHHHGPLHQRDRVWSRASRPVVKCPSANQRGWGGRGGAVKEWWSMEKKEEKSSGRLRPVGHWQETDMWRWKAGGRVEEEGWMPSLRVGESRLENEGKSICWYWIEIKDKQRINMLWSTLFT